MTVPPGTGAYESTQQQVLTQLQSGGTSGTQYTDGAAAPAHPIGNELVYNNAGTMTAVSASNPLPTSATVTPAANQRVNAQSGDFLTGSIVDLLTLLNLAGAAGDANTVASLMGRLTKIRDLLSATLTVAGTITANIDATNSTHLGNIDTATADLVADLDTLITNTGRIPTSPAQEGGNLASLVANTADLLADGDNLATINTSTAAINTTAGQASDANTVNSLMGRLTKIRDLLNATLPISQQSTASTSTTLQNAQNGNAVGTPLSVLGMSSAVLTVNMTGFTGTVNFEGQEDGTNFKALNAVLVGTNTITQTAIGATTTSIALYEIPIAGLQQIQARTSGVSAGTVTVTGHAVPLPYNGKVVNANLYGKNVAVGDTPLGLDASGRITALLQAAAGTALAADQSNTELRASLYGKSTTAGDTALKVNSSGDQYVLGDFTEQASLSSNGLNVDLVPSMDVSAYKSFSIQVTGAWVGTITIQGSNDNVNFSSAAYRAMSSSAGESSTISANLIAIGDIAYRYLRIRMTSYTSGTANGVLELYTSPLRYGAVANAAQLSTWTVQPGNTQNTTPWMITQGPTNVGAQIDVSATATNATCTATMPAVSAKTNYISGYEITGLPATALSSADVTISGLQNTLTAEFAESVGQDNSLIVTWNPPRAASAVNTAISVSIAALGASSSKCACNVHGFVV